MLKIPHCLDSLLSDGDTVVSLTLRPMFYSSETIFCASSTDSCERLSKPEGLVHPEILCKFIKIIHLIVSRTRDLPTSSIVQKNIMCFGTKADGLSPNPPEILSVIRHGQDRSDPT
jgi:hypothetical protein